MAELEIKQTMSSLHIAEITGKPHGDVMKAIRKMESAWKKITQGNFSLSEYKDSTGRTLPMYDLNKTECLYVATKFNDEARAKLVIRWEELEKQTTQPQFHIPQTMSEALLLAGELAQKIETQTPKVEYYDKVLQSDSLITTNIIAKELGLSAIALNKKLNELKIIYREGSSWVLYSKYQDQKLTGTKTFQHDNKTHIHLYWTLKGRHFIHGLIGKKMF